MPTITQIIEPEWTDDLTGLGGLDFYPAMNLNQDEITQVKINLRTLSFLNMNNFTLKVDGSNGSIYQSSGLSEAGIAVGDTFRLVMTGNTNEDNRGIVTSISDNWLLFDTVVWNRANGTYSQESTDVLYITTPIEDIQVSYGLYQDTEQFTSYLDGQTQTYKFSGLDHGTNNVVSGEPIGKNWNTGNITAQFIQTAGSPLPSSGSWTDIAQDFQFIHTFRGQTYNESLRQEILDNNTPFEYKGELTYNYALDFQLFTTFDNPNSLKQKSYSSLGNFGWYGEVFNGGITDREIQNISFVRDSTGETVDGIITNEQTNFSFEITNSAGNIIVLRHKKLAFADDYEVNDTYNNIFFTSDIRVIDNSGVSDGFFTNVSIADNGSNLVVTGSINPNSNDLREESYLFSVSVQSDKNDRCNLPISFGEYVSGFDVEGLIINQDLQLYLRDCTDFTVQGASNYSSVGRGELFNTKFNFEVFDGLIDSIDIQCIARDNTGIYPIYTIPIDISGIQIIDGVQRVNEDLANGGYFRDVGTKQYEIVHPFRIALDPFVRAESLPDSVYDPSQPLDGFGRDIVRLFNLGFDIHIAYKVGMLFDGFVTFYRFRTTELIIKDFEEIL